METNTVNFMTATQNLLTARRQLEEAKEQEKALRVQFAESILADAIESPSRILRLDTYWRRSGLLPMQVEQMVANLINTTTAPEFGGLQMEHTAIRLRYAELDEDGIPTGGYVEKTKELPVIINLGEVKPPRSSSDKRAKQEVFLGAASLIDPTRICKDRSCYYQRQGKCDECPNNKKPATMWKCSHNWNYIHPIVRRILSQQ